MPSAINYVSPSEQGAERSSFNSEVAQERLNRRRRYRTALKYYLGEHPEQLAYEPEDPNDNTNINLVKMTGDRTVSFLFSEIPNILTDEDHIEKNDEEKYLHRVLEANGGLNFLTKVGLRGFLAGHNFIRVKQVPEKFRNDKSKYEKIISLDPTSITIFWRADDMADVIWYEYRYAVGNRIYVKDFVKLDDDTWEIYTYRSAGERSDLQWTEIPTHHGSSGSMRYSIDFIDFERTAFELVETETHNVPIPPIIEFPHLPHPDDYYGLGEATQQQLQDTINRIASERNRIVRENSDPIDVLTGTDASEVEGEGGFYAIANAGAKVTRLEMRGDLSGISETLDKLIETYLSIARVVLLKGDAKDLQRVTNASVRTLFLDAIAKNQVLRENYGSALKRMCELILLMAYSRKAVRRNPLNLNVVVRFAEPLPRDETEIANTNAIGINAGFLDRRNASHRLGYDWAEVSAQIEQEHQDSLRRQREQMELTSSFQTDEDEQDT